MKKKFLSLLMLLCVTFGCAFGSVACDGGEEENSSSIESTVDDPNAPLFSPQFEVDYAGKVTLDMASTATIKKEVRVKTFVDGDTTHFEMDSLADMPQAVKDLGYLKARYAAVNTPESTGTVEKWGKDAANFTKEKLQSATSIVLETDKEVWEPDSTGTRFLVWIWYKPAGSDSYRNLNIELLQYGLALPSKTDDVRYSADALAAITQAKAEKLYIYSNKVDPDFYIGEAQAVTLKELRTNIDAYLGKRVAFEGIIIADNANSVYVQEYDEETGIYYGITAYYGFTPLISSAFKVGYRMRIVGLLSYYETGGTYQINDLKYDLRDLDNPDNVKRLDDKTYEPVYTELTYEEFTRNITVEKEVPVPDSEETTTKTETFLYCKLAMATAISMKNLKVVDVYTTKSGESKGAISLTCEDENGNEITVRTSVLKDKEGNVVTEDLFDGKTIDVKGVVGYYKNENSNYQDFPYQIQVFTLDQITIR